MNDDQFTKEELDLLAYGFGFYVQDFNLSDDDPAHPLLTKLFRLRDEAEAAHNEPPNQDSKS